MTVVIQFPRTSAPQAEARPTARTPLEVYLAGMIVSAPFSVSTARMRSRAQQVVEALASHEVDVLTDVHHVPGVRRPNLLWAILDAASCAGSPAADRMLARTVKAHLASHEASLMDDCAAIEIEEMNWDDAPTPA